MGQADVTDFEAVLKRIRAQAEEENIRITQHAQQEMVEEDITLGEVLEVIATGHILENYTLRTGGDRVVCSTVSHVAAVLRILYVQLHDRRLSSLRSMNRSHRSG